MSMSPEPRASAAGAAQAASATAHLDSVAEQANRTIDTEVQALIDAFKSIVALAAVRDKDAYTAAQGALEAEARAHVMVRAAQSLTLLSHALKLSLLLSLEPVDSKPGDSDEGRTTLNQEALELIARARHERAECLRLLRACGVGAASVGDLAAAAVGPGPVSLPEEQEQERALDMLTTPPLDQLGSGAGLLADPTITAAQSMPVSDAAAAVQAAARQSSAPPEPEEEDEEMEEVPVGT